MKNRPRIHLWIYNHPFNGISDQVKFFLFSMKQHGYAVSVGQKPNGLALNIVIENFSAESRDILRAFCKASRKRIAIIMTEHLDFINGELFIHGDPLWSNNDYMHPATQLNRIKFLIDCIPYIKCFFVLGDLPILKNISLMLPGIPIHSIPFPHIDFIEDKNLNHSSKLFLNDLIFTGGNTEYRENILSILKTNKFSVLHPNQLVSCKKRNLITRLSKITLNIPQRSGWRWLSLMRIIAALYQGRATVSLGTEDDSKISVCTFQLGINSMDWQEKLRLFIENWHDTYKIAYENYIKMIKEYEDVTGFPYDIFDYWAITDQLDLD